MSDLGRLRVQQALLLAFVVHLGIGVLRIPGKAYVKRLRQIQEYRQKGQVRYFMERFGSDTVDTMNWILENTPEDSVLLFRGSWRIAMEFVPALIHPRLLYAEDAVSPGASEVHGRPIARGLHPGVGRGQLVLVGRRNSLELETR
ncbi:MAG: hypothetical protein ACE5F1_08395 [Planctomycetota bacterium]